MTDIPGGQRYVGTETLQQYITRLTLEVLALGHGKQYVREYMARQRAAVNRIRMQKARKGKG